MLKLTGNTLNGSPLCSIQGGNAEQFNFSAYGSSDRTDMQSTNMPGFNGQRRDPLTAVSHLGNGYRAYSPTLMRFTCPDSMSPFGQGGVNPYVYCDADPINRTDPSGHFFLIAFLASLFGSMAAAVTDAVGITGAAVGIEAGVEAGVTAGVEAGVTAMTSAEFASSTAVATTSAAFGGTGTALSEGAAGAGISSVATASAGSIPTASATLGTVNAAIGTAIQTTNVTAKSMAAVFVGSGMAATSFYGRMGSTISKSNAISLSEASVPQNTMLYQSMSVLNSNPLVLTPRITSPGSSDSEIQSQLNRALSSSQKVGAGTSSGIQGTPPKKQYQSSMGYHPSRLQNNACFSISGPGNVSGHTAVAKSKAIITASGIFGISNRELYQESYKSANFKSSSVNKS